MKRKKLLFVLIAVSAVIGTGCGNSQTKVSDEIDPQDVQTEVSELHADTEATTAVIPDSETIVSLASKSSNETATASPATDTSNNFQISGNSGTELNADLDGDGTEDSVIYTCTNADTTITSFSTLFINGTDFSSILQSNNITTFLPSSHLPYYLVDLDNSDSYIDIAIQDAGISDDYVTHFLRYDGTQMLYLGPVSSSMSQYIQMAPIEIIGDGTLTTDSRLTSISLETVSIRVTYILQDGKLIQKEQDWYEIDNESLDEQYRLHGILEDITVNTEPDLNSDTVTLPAGTQNITFDSTDGKQWLVLKTEQGDTYYLYLDSNSKTAAGQDMVSIFSNLLLAD